MNDSYDLGEPVKVRMTFYNNSKKMAGFSHWCDVMEMAFFELQRDGKIISNTAKGENGLEVKKNGLQTTGIMFRRPLLVQPDGKIMVEFDLNLYFDMTMPGKYKITPKPPDGVDANACQISMPITIEVKNSETHIKYEMEGVGP